MSMKAEGCAMYTISFPDLTMNMPYFPLLRAVAFPLFRAAVLYETLHPHTHTHIDATLKPYMSHYTEHIQVRELPRFENN